MLWLLRGYILTRECTAVMIEEKGAKGSLKELEIEQAVSDMKKDELLHQYQFFVDTDEYQENFTKEEYNFIAE